MNKFCLVANMEKHNAADVADSICRYLSERNCFCKMIPNRCQETDGCKFYSDLNEIPRGTQCIIVLGGDGTMIQAARDTSKLGIPLHGVNIGGVGFLTESETDGMWDSIDKLISDDFKVETRLMLEGFVVEDGRKKTDYALNDFVVAKRELGKLIRFEVCINGDMLDSFFADGVIVSTPTGSTGYNLSAGGPVISPEINALVVTPICPHSLNDRSFVIDGNDEVEIRLLEGKNSHLDSAVISVDGRVFEVIESGSILRMKKASLVTKIIHMEKTNFYHKMRSKLSIGGKTD